MNTHVAKQVTYASPPAVLMWQMLYCGVMVAVYLVCAGLGLFLFFAAEELADVDLSVEEARIVGVAFTILGMGMAVLFAIGLFWRSGMGGWVFHIVLLSIGLMSACCWPSNIPLLIFWCKHKDYIVGDAK